MKFPAPCLTSDLFGQYSIRLMGRFVTDQDTVGFEDEEDISRDPTQGLDKMILRESRPVFHLVRIFFQHVFM